MTDLLAGLEPTLLWKYFEGLARIPRGSGKEAAAMAWAEAEARAAGCEVERDAVGNLLARKKATPGMEGRTPVPENEQLHKIAAIGATLVIYLSVGMIDQVVEQLLQGAYRPETAAAVVCRASWEDEQTVSGSLADIAGKVREAGIDRQALIIVGDVLAARRDGLKARSLLYDGGFAHGFRGVAA